MTAAACLVTASTTTQAGVILANGAKDTTMDDDTYRWSNPGGGQILVQSLVPGAGVRTQIDTTVPRRTGTPASIDTGNFITGVRTAVGVAKPKSLTIVTSDAWGTEIKENATNIVAHGSGEWTSTPTPGTFGGTNIVVNYTARTSIRPLPNPFDPFGPYHAYTQVSDPLTLDIQSAGGSFRVRDTLSAFTTDLSGFGSNAGGALLVSDMQLDGNDLYSVSIYVPAGFAGSGDVTVRYLDRLGQRDTQMESSLLSALTIDPATQLVSLDTPFDVYPEASIGGLSVGSHTIGGRLVTGVSVPEPGALSAFALAGLVILRRHRHREALVEP
jgi:hypothetical protein